MPKTNIEKKGPVQTPGSGFFIDGTEVIGAGNTWGVMVPNLMLLSFSATNDTAYAALPVACRLTRIRTTASTAPGTGEITILKNGSTTSHTLTTSAVTDDSGNITSGTTFAAGDSIGVKITSAGNNVILTVLPELTPTA